MTRPWGLEQAMWVLPATVMAWNKVSPHLEMCSFGLLPHPMHVKVDPPLPWFPTISRKGGKRGGWNWELAAIPPRNIDGIINKAAQGKGAKIPKGGQNRRGKGSFFFHRGERGLKNGPFFGPTGQFYCTISKGQNRWQIYFIKSHLFCPFDIVQ